MPHPRVHGWCSTHGTGEGEYAVGGACVIPVTPGETVRVDVADDLRGADVPLNVTFMAVVTTPILDGEPSLWIDETTPCAPPVLAVGSVEVVVPAGCSHVDVRLGAEATTGTLSIRGA